MSSKSGTWGERISCCFALFVAVLLAMSFCDLSHEATPQVHKSSATIEKLCDEIYMVREGETLQSISEKCGDPYIVEKNPHIHDPDDVFPGLVIKITPFKVS